MTATFNDQVYSILSQIPAGSVTSYGEIAKLAGYPSHARQVARVLKNLPKDTKLPWHRVLNSRHHIALPIDSPSGQQQRQRLLDEGAQIVGVRVSFPSSSSRLS
ncbi:MGMT family protein [Umboniibacter marinipuniceus]|uniref:Methylated-DNA-protein-cysteine methyltransferase-like protein n=1 Tax=Umboniibacter marinipuniceus TaxID=569599 RepID=A0A3M0AAG9_9GAMM|nr:MGMT family protein [Umboniibacter marinipuniceus]RMA79385.1 methylated-DNA-protein-cysteine methyltransferase-like protein [Umboniibacter marinipuniceus]